MDRFFIGGAAAIVAAGLAVPAIVGWREQGTIPALGMAMLVSATLLTVGGLGGLLLGIRQRPRRSIPVSVMVALSINALFLGLLALEISHGLARQGGVVAKSWFFFPPASLLFWGLLTRRRWARLVARWGALAFALLYIAVGLFACVHQFQDEHGPVWIWIALVSLALASLLFLGGFHPLGRSTARKYFGAERTTTTD